MFQLKWFYTILGFIAFASVLNAQVTDTTQLEEDFSQYDNVSFADEGAKRYCNPKIMDLAPQRLISLSWDHQLAYDATMSAEGSYEAEDDATVGEKGRVNSTSGIRLFANIPVISTNSIVWQLGMNYWDMNYNISKIETTNSNGLLEDLNANGLRTGGLHTTIFKPLGEKQFLIIQAAADVNGDYNFDNEPSLDQIKYSGALIWGKRPNDRKQWGVGISRTYRVGEMNYIPVFLFNWTAPNRKWGTEILFPARANVRRTISSRSILTAGYELEGASYKMTRLSTPNSSFELRRGELRARVEYQRQLKGFIWFSAQAGFRHDWSFNADRVEDGGDFFRGFFGNQKYVQLNRLQNPLYFNIGIHLVSP